MALTFTWMILEPLPGCLGASAAHIQAVPHGPPICSYPTVKNRMKYLACAGLIFCAGLSADPVVVRHTQGYIHGLLVLKDTNDKILASGDLVQIPSGNRVTDTPSLHFAD